jgi:dihydroorotate dehydrogenase
MGIDFPNPVGLAAGLDKNGDYIDALAALGFGFLEIGTTTPRPQPGNPKPRMFRLEEHEAIINRLGFNNGGVERPAAQRRARELPRRARASTSARISTRRWSARPTTISSASKPSTAGRPT